MGRLLLTFIGLIVVIAIVFVGGMYFIMNKKTDLNDPEVAAKFQTNMEDVCFKEGKTRLEGRGTSLDYQQEALVKQFCACWMKEVTKILAKKGGRTPAEVQKTYFESREEVTAAYDSCGAAYGL